MDTRRPHYLLYSHTDSRSQPGAWRVIVKKPDGSVLLEAADTEPDVQGERLELLAVIRGLEALDQPARVTLATPSRYVRRGLAYGLDEWRNNGWSWECFGRMVPIKNQDLWQRLDRALKFHDVQCRRWRIDAAHPWLQRPQREQSTALTPQLVKANAFDLATAEVTPPGVNRPTNRPRPARVTSPIQTPPARRGDGRYGPVSTFIRALALLLLRFSYGSALAPAGRTTFGTRK